MPSFRLLPLLAAGAACLTLAACGGDDDPPPQAAAPPQTTSAAPTQTAPAPTGTTDDDADTGAAADRDTGTDAGEATPPPAPDDTNDQPSSPPPNDANKREDDLKTGTSKDGESSGRDRGAGGGGEAAKVRAALIGLQEAVAAKDGQKACSLMIGVPQKSDPKNPGLSCESLSQGPKTTLPEADRKTASSAKVTIAGNDATAELAPGLPMKLRKIDGRWRVDYTEMLQKPAGSR